MLGAADCAFSCQSCTDGSCGLSCHRCQANSCAICPKHRKHPEFPPEPSRHSPERIYADANVVRKKMASPRRSGIESPTGKFHLRQSPARIPGPAENIRECGSFRSGLKTPTGAKQQARFFLAAMLRRRRAGARTLPRPPTPQKKNADAGASGPGIPPADRRNEEKTCEVKFSAPVRNPIRGTARISSDSFPSPFLGGWLQWANRTSAKIPLVIGSLLAGRDYIIIPAGMSNFSSRRCPRVAAQGAGRSAFRRWTSGMRGKSVPARIVKFHTISPIRGVIAPIAPTLPLRAGRGFGPRLRPGALNKQYVGVRSRLFPKPPPPYSGGNGLKPVLYSASRPTKGALLI